MRLIARTVSFPDLESDRLTRSTEMINDKSGDPLLDLRKRTWRAHEEKNCFSNLKKRLEAGNYPIKFFRATKKGRITLFILVIVKRLVCSYSNHKSNLHNSFNFTLNCDSNHGLLTIVIYTTSIFVFHKIN